MRLRFLIFPLLSTLSLLATAQSSHYSALCNVMRQPSAASAQPNTSVLKVNVEGRQTSHVTSVIAPGARRIMMLRDTGGSMRYENAQKLAFSVAEYFIGQDASSDQFGLINFNEEPFVDIPLVSGPDFLKQWADFKISKRMRATEGSGLFDAVIAAVEFFKKNQPQEGDSIFIISDGIDTASRARVSKMKEMLVASKTRLYWFFLDIPTLQRADFHKRTELTETVAATGGAMTGARPSNTFQLKNAISGPTEPVFDLSDKTLASIKPNVQAFRGLIDHPLRIEFDLDSPLSKAAKMTVSFQDASGMQTLCPGYLLPN
ncbi:MAG: von Willebrand factor type [Acidobacteriales bacterium]|nr:von Willebrand factor type [Terriglobales bacterium]